MVKAKIQSSQLINRLQDHVLKGTEMTDSQIKAATILLNKTLSNAPTELSAPDGKDLFPFTKIVTELVKAK